ncbi:DUF6223 family protein [Microbispora bryophytorum]|uniref:DUF6223 family protein n=1 Tax=Microbispora bryophytorum TaxID=1460882 RepID=UPI0033E3DC39
MSVSHLLAAAPAALLGYAGHAAPSAAQFLVQPAGVGAYALTAGRLWALAAMMLGLAGVIVGGLALTRSRRIG